MHPDTLRIQWLEHMARNCGGIILFNGVDTARERQTAVGIGLRPGRVNQTLREGIDSAMPDEWSVGLAITGQRVDSEGNYVEG